MDIREEKLIGNIACKHWYYVSKSRIVEKILRDTKAREALDVGAGSGIFSRKLIESGICDQASCLDINYDKEWTEKHCGRLLKFIRRIQGTSYDLILMMDVLEHVGDDITFLHQYAKRLRPGGLILITVPAFQVLWSGHDIFLGHKRRYRLKQIENLVEEEGLEIICSRYYYGLLFPVFILIRLWEKFRLREDRTKAKSALKRYPTVINWALIWLHDLERLFIFPFNKFAGLTIFCLAKKTR